MLKQKKHYLDNVPKCASIRLYSPNRPTTLLCVRTFKCSRTS